MKKVLVIAIAFVCMFSLFACAENDGENGSNGDAVKDSGKVLFTSDDVVTQSSSVKTKLCTVKKVNDDGTITVTEWSKTENENGEYTFKKEKDETIEIDKDTKIIMCDIKAYSEDAKKADCKKTMTLDYFLGNATEKLNGEPLYFNIMISKGRAAKVELFWNLYFED